MLRRFFSMPLRTDLDGPGMGMGKIFSDPGLIGKLAANPKTAPLLSDASFMAKLRQIQANPNDAGAAFQDPRMIQVMGVAMGIDLQAFERPQGSDDLPADLESKRDEIDAQTKAAAASASQSSQPEPMPSSKKEEAPPAPEAEMEDAEAGEDQKAKEAADKEKAQGNALYVKRQFDAAIEHYKKAWELHKDITYLNNLAGEYMPLCQESRRLHICSMMYLTQNDACIHSMLL